MSRGTVAAVLALAAGGALASAGDEPTTHEVTWKARWKAGQVVTETEHEANDTESSMGGKVLRREHAVLDTTCVLRCDEVDAQGEPTKRTLFVRSWKQIDGTQVDESISGLRVEFEGAAWSLPEGKQAGPLARKWLGRKFRKGGEDPLSKLAPPRLEIGKPWKPDPKAAAEAFAQSMEDAPFDLARIEMEVTLASVEGAPPDETGTCVVKIRFPIAAKLPGLPDGAVVLPGSGGELAGTRTGPLTTSTMLGTENTALTFAMNIDVNANGQKVAFRTKGTMTTDRKRVAGGEIPEAPVPPAAKPPASGGK